MKTTSLELSKQLKEAGAKQNAESYVAYRGDEVLQYVWKPSNQALVWPEGTELCDIFNTDELLERLPTRIEGKGHQQHWWFHMIKAMVPKYGVGYARWIINELPGVETIYLENFNASGDTPAEALGKLYLWCLKNGHCDD